MNNYSEEKLTPSQIAGLTVLANKLEALDAKWPPWPALPARRDFETGCETDWRRANVMLKKHQAAKLREIKVCWQYAVKAGKLLRPESDDRLANETFLRAAMPFLSAIPTTRLAGRYVYAMRALIHDP